MARSGRSMLVTGILLVMASALQGCSVGLALVGEKDPDLSVVCEGAERRAVEEQLGRPVRRDSTATGACVDTYRYLTGNEPSPRRALLHVAANVLMLGMWEVYGASHELTVGEDHLVVVTYDENDRVRSIDEVIADLCMHGQPGCACRDPGG